MELTHIEHLGIAVKSIEACLPYYEQVLGLKCYSIEEFIEKKGEGIHHIAFATPDVQACLDEAEAKGVRLIDKAPRRGAEGLDIAFLHPKSTCSVLTELCMPGKK